MYDFRIIYVMLKLALITVKQYIMNILEYFFDQFKWCKIRGNSDSSIYRGNSSSILSIV